MRRRWAALASVVGLVALLVAGSAQAAEPATAPGLPVVTSGHRPGPDILYAPRPVAPMLESRDPRFAAPPILVSGHEAYVDGEYLYQDHLYDDYGADTNFMGATALQARYGDINPPTTAAKYGGNGADLVELRIAPSGADVAYRFTYNTLLAADAPIATIAFDTDDKAATGSDTLVPDPGSPFPGTDEVITVWGGGGAHYRLPTGGAPLLTELENVDTDLDANQVTVRVPRTTSNPTGTWHMTWATGLYDGHGGWLRPQQNASATMPGGTNGRSGVTGIFNVGPRFNEPYLGEDTPPDTAQAAALRDANPIIFQRAISWDDLDTDVNRTTVPTSGTTVRIFPSRLNLGEGRNLGSSVAAGGPPQYLGQLQPYSLYVPTAAADSEPDPFTLSLHSLGEQHWQYNGAAGIQQIGEQRGSFVATPMARGSGMWYQDAGEADVFEAWADVAHHFLLDPDRTAVSGYSMGGYGTYRLGGLYPDLFGKAYSTVGPPADGIWVPPLPASGGEETNSNNWLENNRNLPYFNLVAAQDELVPIRGTVAQNLGDSATRVIGFEQLGYRYRFRIYDPAEHLTIGALSYDVKDVPGFLDDGTVDRDPTHVTFSHLPASDSPGLVHDHAYWVADVAVADDAVKGTVDVFTHGHGFGDPVSAARTPAVGVDPIAYTEVGRDWGPAPAIPVQNRLDVRLSAVKSTALDLARAAIVLTHPVLASVDTDRPATLLLEGDFAAPTVVGALTSQVTSRGLELTVPAGHSDIVITEAGVEPVVPETALVALLPLGAIAIGVVVLMRRRRHHG